MANDELSVSAKRDAVFYFNVFLLSFSEKLKIGPQKKQHKKRFTFSGESEAAGMDKEAFAKQPEEMMIYLTV